MYINYQKHIIIDFEACTHMTKEPISQIIRDARKKQKLKQRELAALAGISIGTLLSLEKDGKTVGYGTVERVLNTLGLHIWIK